MNQQKCAFGLVFFAMIFGMSAVSNADMTASEKDASVRKMGVAWNIADDRKMENISGIYEPEGLDKYMKRYFEQFTAKLDVLSSKIDRLSEQIRQMEATLAKKDAPKSSFQSKIV